MSLTRQAKRISSFCLCITEIKEGFRIAVFDQHYDPKHPGTEDTFVTIDPAAAGDIVATILTKLITAGE